MEVPSKGWKELWGVVFGGGGLFVKIRTGPAISMTSYGLEQPCVLDVNRFFSRRYRKPQKSGRPPQFCHENCGGLPAAPSQRCRGQSIGRSH